MGMASLHGLSLPDIADVNEVIRLADAATIERREQRLADGLSYRADDHDAYLRPSPARREMITHLRRLQERDNGLTVAQLYGLYKAGDITCTSREEAIERYHHSTELALQPIHRPHGAGDLAGKAPLADNLRRGLALLGFTYEGDPSGRAD